MNTKLKLQAAMNGPSQSTRVGYEYPAPLPDYCVRYVNCLCFGQCRKSAVKCHFQYPTCGSVTMTV